MSVNELGPLVIGGMVAALGFLLARLILTVDKKQDSQSEKLDRVLISVAETRTLVNEHERRIGRLEGPHLNGSGVHVLPLRDP